MAHRVYTIRLAFKMPVPAATQAHVDKLVAEIVEAAKLADTVNLGQDNAEAPIALTHICRHDEGLPCDPPEPIKLAEVEPL